MKMLNAYPMAGWGWSGKAETMDVPGNFMIAVPDMEEEELPALMEGTVIFPPEHDFFSCGVLMNVRHDADYSLTISKDNETITGFAQLKAGKLG